MKLTKVSLEKSGVSFPPEISDSGKLLRTLRTVTFPESFFLYQGNGPLEKGILERPVLGLPGVRISEELLSSERAYSFRLLSAELLLPLRFLEAHLGSAPIHPLTWSAYFAKKRSPGLLALHEDLHDVYVFQVFGKRIWEVEGQKTELSAGDLLKIPLGVPHRVLETPEDSFHVTVGQHFPTAHALLRDLLENYRSHPLLHRVLNDDETFRKKIFQVIAES